MKKDFRTKECQSIATHGSVPLGHLAERTLGEGGCVLGNLAAANDPHYQRPAIKAGQLESLTDPKGQVRKYSYDDAGRVTGETQHKGECQNFCV